LTPRHWPIGSGKCPAVAAWFRTAYLGKPLPEGIATVRTMLDDWLEGTVPPLHAQLLLCGNGRREAAASLQAWAKAPLTGPESSRTLTVTASDRSEATAFMAAALALDPLDGVELESRALVVSNESAFLHAKRLRNEKLIVVLDGSFERPTQLTHGRMIELKVPSERTSDNNVVLGAVPWNMLCEDLQRFCGIDRARAERLAHNSRGDLSALRTELDAADPAWVRSDHIDELCTILLLGRVQTGRALDEELVNEVLGQPMAALVRFLDKLRNTSGSPVEANPTRHGQFLRFAAHEAAWNLLAPKMPTGVLERFVEAAIKALSRTDLPQWQHEALSISVARLGCYEKLPEVQVKRNKRFCRSHRERSCPRQGQHLVGKPKLGACSPG
jgi:hypothetical protein